MTKKTTPKIGTTVFVPYIAKADGKETVLYRKGKVTRIRIEVKCNDGWETLMSPANLLYEKDMKGMKDYVC